MTDVGITGYGAYVPINRLNRQTIHAANAWFAPELERLARGERAFCSWDEDVITMAVEAARNCLGDRDRSRIKALVLASTTAPFADRQNAGVVKEALNLPDETLTWDASGGRRAGLSALLQALAMAPATGQVLCMASEREKVTPASERELLCGHAAAAVEVGTGALLARLVASHSLSVDFVDRFRAAGRDIAYEWESRWVRDEGYGRIATASIQSVLAKAGLPAQQISHFILPAPPGAMIAVAKACGLSTQACTDALTETVGDSGTAHPLVMLVRALETARPGEKILAAAFGNGCDAVILERHAGTGRGGVGPWLERRQLVGEYTKFLSFGGALRLEQGKRAELPDRQPLTTLYRHRKDVLALIAGRCVKTGTVQFPKSDISVDPRAPLVGTQVDHPLAERTARILTHTADYLTSSPSPPACYGTVEFEGGGRLTTEFVDVAPEALAIGQPMRMMFRIKSIDEARGFTKYFWKAAPAA